MNTGGGANAKQRTAVSAGGGGGSASSGCLRRWYSISVSSPDVPAPSEWPVTISSNDGSLRSASTTATPAAVHTTRAIAAIPACAKPPQNGVACATASCTASEIEAVPRSASTTALAARSTHTMCRRQSASPATSSDSVSIISRSAGCTPVCSQIASVSICFSPFSAMSLAVGRGISPNTAISAVP